MAFVYSFIIVMTTIIISVFIQDSKIFIVVTLRYNDIVRG